MTVFCKYSAKGHCWATTTHQRDTVASRLEILFATAEAQRSAEHWPERKAQISNFASGWVRGSLTSSALLRVHMQTSGPADRGGELRYPALHGNPAPRTPRRLKGSPAGCPPRGPSQMTAIYRKLSRVPKPVSLKWWCACI